jgi:hypothetical protein
MGCEVGNQLNIHTLAWLIELTFRKSMDAYGETLLSHRSPKLIYFSAS